MSAVSALPKLPQPFYVPKGRLTLKRFLRLDKVHRLLASNGDAYSVRTLERWCQLGKWPARKRGMYWEVDLRALKSAPEHMDLYEELAELVNGRDNRI